MKLVLGIQKAAFLAALLLALSLGPTTGQRIRVLALGQVMPAECPLPHWFPNDPLLELALIPTDTDTISSFTMEEARRYVRMYFPRTERDLLVFDFFMYPDANLQPLSDIQINRLSEAVVKNGKSALVTMGGGLNSPEGNVWYTWLGTTLAEAMPVKMDPAMKRPDSSFSIHITKDDPPVLSMFKPLGIERVVGYHYTTLFEKEGSDIWAVVKPFTYYKSDTPWLVSISYPGGGNFWAVADDIDHGWWWYMHHHYENPYSFDVLVNIILQARGRRLPTNIEVVHKAREEFRSFSERRQVLVSIMDFVEKFGGNVRKIEEMVADLEGLRKEAESEYTSQNFDDAFDLLKEAERLSATAMVKAMKIKNQSLFYVYLIEWFTVTGTLLVSGSVLYSLMVRRSRFREVSVTKSR